MTGSGKRNNYTMRRRSQIRMHVTLRCAAFAGGMDAYARGVMGKIYIGACVVRDHFRGPLARSYELEHWQSSTVFIALLYRHTLPHYKHSSQSELYVRSIYKP